MERYMKSMPYNMLRLCIDECEDYHIKGRIYNPTLTNPIYFHDVNEAFLQADHIFNKNGNPLAAQSIRSFQGKEEVSSFRFEPPICIAYRELLNFKGQQITFDILVKSRRKATWQGILFYQGESIVYDTILDLINIILEFIKKEELYKM